MYAAIFQISADNLPGFTPMRLNWKRVSMDFELAHISAISAVSDAYFLAIGKSSIYHLLHSFLFMIPS